MEKIGKCVKYLLLLGLFFNVSVLNAVAQSDVKVEATVSQATIYPGGRIKLNITISGELNKISLPDLPKIKGFNLLSSTPSTSRRFSYRNGVSKTSYTYSYFLAAQQKGTFTIPPISVEIDGKQYQTQPITVEVVDRSTNTDASGDDSKVFLKMKVSDHTVVPGEQIIANVILFFKNNIQVATYQPIPGWKAKGFWKERLKNSGRPVVKSAVINGTRYNKARLMQFALFPTKKGELTLSPYQVNLVVQTVSRRSRFNGFFGGFNTDRRRLKLKTDPITIEVNPIPQTDSLVYTGGVGKFNIKRQIKADTVKAGETIEIVTTISGTGNIPLITKPDYKLPSDLEVYQPQTKVDINRSGSRISGTKTFTDIVVPRNAGSVTIPSTTISWYNPRKEKFIEKKLSDKTIFVKANLSKNTSNGTTGKFTVSPVTGLANWELPPTKKTLSNYWWFWVGIFLPLAGLAVAYWKKTYNEKMANNFSFARAQQAKAVADKKLQQAIQNANNGQVEKAYNSLQQAITGFIGDKLNMPEAGLSIEQYIEALEKQKVNNELIKNVRTLLNKCATVNYAPEESSDYIKSHVELGKSIIKKLKKAL